MNDVELINILDIDNNDYYYSNLLKKNIELYNIVSSEQLDKKLKTLKEGETIEDEMCKFNDKNIVKVYTNFKDLLNDNNKQLYVDKTLNTQFSEDLKYYKNLKKRNNANNVASQIKNYLMERGINNDSIINQEITYLINEEKPIKNGDYAILINNTSENNEDSTDEKKNEYYIWSDNRWEKESCFDRKGCIENSNDDCSSVAAIKKIREIKYINNFVENQTRAAVINKELLSKNADIELNEKKKQLTNKLYINLFNKVKIHERNVKYSELYKRNDIEISPYEGLRNKILGLKDIEQRYTLLITFSKKYTRPGIDPFWFYCIDSNNVKLLPTMLVEKAKARLSGSIEEYNNVINKLCNTQGQISDDGESWIDKYSGYVIKKIEDVEDEEYNELGMKLSYHDVIETDIDMYSGNEDETKTESMISGDSYDIFYKEMKEKLLRDIVISDYAHLYNIYLQLVLIINKIVQPIISTNEYKF